MLILSNTDNLSMMGMKKLAKLLYFADFNYYAENHESITSESYKRFDHGPMPESLYDAIEELDSEGFIEAEKGKISASIEKWNFEIKEEFELENIEPEHREWILGVLDKLDYMNAQQLEDLSHRDTPWQVTDDLDNIKYKLVFYRDDELEEFFG